MSPFWFQTFLWAARISRLVLAGIFLYAGIVKASASEQFAVALAPFTILPEWSIGVFARTLPWIEVGAAILILLPRVHRIGSALILFLCLLFAGALTWALANGIIVSCGCFGGDEPPSAATMQLAILRDIALATLSLIALLSPQKPKAAS